MGVLSWRTLVGPAWCSPVIVSSGECSSELYFERKLGFSEEYGKKLTSVQSR